MICQVCYSPSPVADGRRAAPQRARRNRKEGFALSPAVLEAGWSAARGDGGTTALGKHRTRGFPQYQPHTYTHPAARFPVLELEKPLRSITCSSLSTAPAGRAGGEVSSPLSLTRVHIVESSRSGCQLQLKAVFVRGSRAAPGAVGSCS